MLGPENHLRPSPSIQISTFLTFPQHLLLIKLLKIMQIHANRLMNLYRTHSELDIFFFKHQGHHPSEV